MLTIPFEFKSIDGEDDRHFASLQTREDISQKHDSMKVTTLMRVFDLEAFMLRKARTSGKLTAVKCAELYQEHLTLASGSEDITPGFVDMVTRLKLLSMLSMRKLWGSGWG